MDRGQFYPSVDVGLLHALFETAVRVIQGSRVCIAGAWNMVANTHSIRAMRLLILFITGSQ
jgi:hypothetical protein